MSGDDRTLLVDASVIITLAEVGRFDLVAPLDSTVPKAVVGEVVDDPGATHLQRAIDEQWLEVAEPQPEIFVDRARVHLGRDETGDVTGDTALLAHAMRIEDTVVVTDDRPLREACKALSIPVSGSIGVLVRAVERGDIEAGDASETLYAMDEVGARLSASLLRRTETLIEEAADDP